MRNKLLLLGIFSTGMLYTNAQLTAGLGLSANSQTYYLSNLSGKPSSLLDRTDIEGSPFLSEDFKTAVVVLPSGQAKENVPVRFNIYNNEIQFKNEQGQEFALEEFKYIAYLDTPGDSSSLKVFAMGYPAVEGNSSKTVYQMVAGGKNVQLLKLTTQKIEPKKTMGYYNLKELVKSESYYIYMNGKGLQKVKLNGDNIREALPGYEEKIAAIVKNQKLNLKKTADVVSLINQLEKAG